MARTTDSAVFEVIETTLTDIDTFITTANLFVTNTLGSTSLDDTTLEDAVFHLWRAPNFLLSLVPMSWRWRWRVPGGTMGVS